MKLRIIFFLFVFSQLALFGSLTSSPAGAQWKKIATLKVPVDCGFFFDEARGFVGTGLRESLNNPAEIFQTSDGGAAWRQMVTPGGYGVVTSIQMTNAMTGYASVYTDQNQILWQTSDGGNTWFDNSPDQGSEATCVYVTPAAITLTRWHGIGGSSAIGFNNFGQTFFGGDADQSNGIDFTDNYHGVASIGPGANGAYYTSDGGATWNGSNGLPESWSVYALKGTHAFYSAAEDQSFRVQRIYRSTDDGRNWSPIYTFNTFGIHCTGHIGGKGNTLYVQTENGTNAGFYRSDDLGLSWKNVGGPSHYRDTRFVVTSCNGSVVYAFDILGNIYKTIDGGDGTIPPATNPPFALGSITSAKAGEYTMIPVFFRPLSAKFTVTTVAFHLTFNGDVLTPDTLSTSGTLSEKATLSQASLSGNSGVSGVITLSKPITEKTDFTIPLVRVHVRAALSDSMATNIAIDSFAVNGQTALGVCGFSVTRFTLLPQCGDTTISYAMKKNPLINLLGFSPNPSHGGELQVAFHLAILLPVRIELIDAYGQSCYRNEQAFAEGTNTFELNTSALTSGTYFLVVSVPGQAPVVAKVSQLR